MANFPNGINDLVYRESPVTTSRSGQTFWVNNSTVLAKNGTGGSNGNPGTYTNPFLTIDFAIGKCTANRFDVIEVMPNHVEVISGAAGIDLDVAAVTIIGHGSGSTQSKVTFTDAASTFEVNTTNWKIDGLWLEATVTAVAKGIDVINGADDGAIVNCRFSAETLATDEFEDAVFVTTADRCDIVNNTFDMDAGTAQSAIHHVGACLGGNVLGNTVKGDYAVACIESVSAGQEQIIYQNNTLINGVHANLNTIACISLHSSATAYIDNNDLYTNVSSPATGAIVAAAAFLGDKNYISTTAESTGLIAEGSALGGPMQSTADLALADEASATMYDVTGVVAVYGVVVHAETVGNSATTVAIATDCTDETLNATLSSTLDVELTVLGDTAASATAGGILVHVESPGDLTPIWPSPAIVTAGVITYVKGGTAGAGIHDFTIYWKPVSDGATIAAE